MQKITINGVEYPATFSLRAAIHAAEKYGSVQAIFDGGDEASNITKRIWLLHELLVSGKTYAEKEYGEQTPEVPTFDDLLDTIGFTEITELTALILSVVTEDQRAKIGVEAKKNGPTLAQ